MNQLASPWHLVVGGLLALSLVAGGVATAKLLRTARRAPSPAGHLRRLGLLDRFVAVCTRGDVERVQPDPEFARSGGSSSASLLLRAHAALSRCGIASEARAFAG